MKSTDFVTRYLEHTSGGETPMVFNRWACLTGLSAMLEKNVYLYDGLGNTYANMYTMLVGSAGTRKSTAIKTMIKYMKQAGYKNIASDSATKEAFLHFMAHASSNNTADIIADDPNKLLFQDINAPSDSTTPVLIAADEFQNFFSNNITEFLSTLGELWDYEGMYEGIARTGNYMINNPNVTMITGNTTETLCRVFPVEALGQGFFSRQLFIHGEPNGVKIAFPEPPDEEEVAKIIKELSELPRVHNGEIKFTPEAKEAAATIYETAYGHPDPRFSTYDTRRFTHLKKLCIIHAIADHSNEIKLEHVIRANTVLTVAEFSMPKALGEYGISRNSRVMHKIVTMLETSIEPHTHQTLLAAVRHDLEKTNEYFPLINMLVGSRRIKETSEGYLLPIRSKLEKQDDPFIDWDYMSSEEIK